MTPTLLILAAGMGSRYGSMKQTEQFGPSGETITDYSIYDAVKSGFGKVVFVISPAMEEEFTDSFIKKFPSKLNIDYVIQSVDTIPSGYRISSERKKPWGTAHAVLMAAPKINEPFAVINADDFYGRNAYKLIAEYLTSTKESGIFEYCMAGYRIRQTLSEYGTVSRGICEVDDNGYLTEITERTKIIDSEEGITVLDNGVKFLLPENALVSMNFFGFTPSVFAFLEKYFIEFLEKNGMDPKSEFFIPFVADKIIKEGLARLKVLETDEKWFGVTYKEDRPHVLKMINTLVENGIYPRDLWGTFQNN